MRAFHHGQPRRKISDKSAMITSGPIGALPPARIVAKLAATSPSMTACSFLNNPHRADEYQCTP
jgi:hypothetical protein